MVLVIVPLSVSAWTPAGSISCPAEYSNSYVLNLSNDGSNLNGKPELVFIENISSIYTANASKTDLLLVMNSSNVSYQFMNGNNAIVFLVNRSVSTMNNMYAICSNATSANTFVNNVSSIINVYKTGMMEAGEGYSDGGSILSLNNWAAAGSGAAGNYKTTVNKAYRGAMSYCNNITSSGGGGVGNLMTTSSTDVYFTYYSNDFSNSAQSDFYLGSATSGAAASVITQSDYNAQTVTVTGSSAIKLGTDSNTWGVWNGHVNGANIINVSFENITKTMNGTNTMTAKTNKANQSNFMVYNNGVIAAHYYDNIFISTTEIWQYMNFTTSNLGANTPSVNAITLNSITPINYTYTSNNNQTFTFNITAIIGTFNATLWLNNSVSYGSNNSISSSGTYTIKALNLPMGAEYLWYINATSGSINSATELRNIYTVGNSTGGGSNTDKKICSFPVGSIAINNMSGCV